MKLSNAAICLAHLAVFVQPSIPLFAGLWAGARKQKDEDNLASLTSDVITVA